MYKKNESRLTVILDKNLKKMFVKACKSKGLNSSIVLRQLIRDYVIKNSNLFS